MSTAEEISAALNKIAGALPPYFVEQYERFLAGISITLSPRANETAVSRFLDIYSAHARQKTPEEAITYTYAILETLGWEELDDLRRFVNRSVVIDTSMNEELKRFQKFEAVYDVMGILGNKLRDHQLNRYRLAVTVLVKIDTDKSFVEIFTILRQKLTLYPLAVAFTIKVLERSAWGGTRELKPFALPNFDLNERYPVVDLCLTVADYYGNMYDKDFNNAKTFVSAVHLDDMNVRNYNRVDFTLLLLKQCVISVGDVSKIKDDRRHPVFFKEYEERHKGIGSKYEGRHKGLVPVPPVGHFPEMKDITIEPKPFSTSLVKGITVLLMTATPLELQGIMGYLKPKDDNEKIIETYTDAEAGKVRFYIGKYGQYPVVVGMSAPSKSHQGPTSACNVTTKLMNTVKPRYVIAVGICYGIDKSKTSSGDVIVSDLICDYTSLRVGDTLQPRGGIPPVGATLLSMFGSSMGYSHIQDGKEVKVHCSPFISKPDLIDNPIYKEKLKHLRPDALGGEMEGAGIMAAVENDTSKHKVEAIVIKAICDWGDGEKSEAAGWKPFSSHAVARYVHHQMDKPTGVLN